MLYQGRRKKHVAPWDESILWAESLVKLTALVRLSIRVSVESPILQNPGFLPESWGIQHHDFLEEVTIWKVGGEKSKGKMWVWYSSGQDADGKRWVFEEDKDGSEYRFFF